MIIPIDNCGEIGLIQDAYSQELAPNGFNLARNFRFREGYAEKFSGHAPVYGTPIVPPYFLANFLSASGNQWVYAGLEKIYAIDPDKIHTNITRQTDNLDVNYTGNETNKWNGGVLSGIVVMNNGVDIPQYWPGTGRAADIPQWPIDTRCKILRPFRNYLLALNVAKGDNWFPHLIKWSHHAEPGLLPDSWDVTDTTKDAGEYDLADDQTELVDGLTLGEQFIAYKGSGYYSVQYIGTPFIFRFQKISGLYGGALAANCVTEFPGGHFVLGRNDVYVHQGGMPESVIDGRNRKWLFKQLDNANQQKAFVTSSPNANELWVCFPQSSGETCSLALVWNWKYNTWGVRELPGVVHAASGSVDFTPSNTWDTFNETWASLGVTWMQNVSTLPLTSIVMASPAEQKLHSIELGTKFDDLPFESFIARDNIRFDRPHSVKLLREVRPLIEGPIGATVNIFIASSYDQTSDPVWFGPYPFTIGSMQKIDCHVIGRMLGIMFSATGDFPWRLKRYELELTEIGSY